MFEFGNGKPSQPIVQISPRAPKPGDTLVADVELYSIDPDDDIVDLDIRWRKSVDGGVTWIEKQELNDLPFVEGQLTAEGELWEVRCTPREAFYGNLGKTAVDVVFIGNNSQAPPTVTATQPLSRPGTQEGTSHVEVAWTATDPDGGPVTTTIYLTDLKFIGQEMLAQDIGGQTGHYEFDRILPASEPHYLQLVTKDDEGAVTQVTTLPIEALEVGASGWMLE